MVSTALQVLEGSTKAEPSRLPSEAWKEQSLLGTVGQSGEAGLAAGIGADLKVELAEVHESVGDVDADGGGVDGRLRGIGYCEFGGAWADAAIDDGDGFGVGRGGALGWQS